MIILVQVLIISYQLFSVVLELLPHLACLLLLLMTAPSKHHCQHNWPKTMLSACHFSAQIMTSLSKGDKLYLPLIDPSYLYKLDFHYSKRSEQNSLPMP